MNITSQHWLVAFKLLFLEDNLIESNPVSNLRRSC